MIDDFAQDLRLGRWQDVLTDVESCDSLICDPPYSKRTAEGYRSHGMIVDARTAGISYGHITEEDAEELAILWAWRTQRWAVIFSDHIAWRWHEAAWSRAGWVTFAPVFWARKNAPPRFRGDGPASQGDWILVARKRGLEPDGSRPGWYLVDGHRTGIVGSKNANGMRAVVRHYSRRGDLVVDPFAGSGTTALACALEGRRCITSEVNLATYEIARRRFASYTPDLPFMEGQEA